VAGATIVNTIFGPVEVGAAVGDYGHVKVFFQKERNSCELSVLARVWTAEIKWLIAKR
jgi:hypothetical protein